MALSTFAFDSLKVDCPLLLTNRCVLKALQFYRFVQPAIKRRCLWLLQLVGRPISLVATVMLGISFGSPFR